MTGLVYILCAATALASAVLLLRGAVTSGGGLLLWSSFCFFAMALNNALLWLDPLMPNLDFFTPSRLVMLAGIVLLNIGLIRHST
jgi:hypothetical protein